MNGSELALHPSPTNQQLLLLDYVGRGVEGERDEQKGREERFKGQWGKRGRGERFN